MGELLPLGDSLGGVAATWETLPEGEHGLQCKTDCVGLPYQRCLTPQLVQQWLALLRNHHT